VSRLAATLVLLSVTIASSAAQAEEPRLIPGEPGPTMDEQLDRYFVREKEGGKGFIGAGAVSVTLGASFLLARSEFVNGVGYPFLALGAIEVAVGSVVYLRTDAQVARLQTQLRDAPGAYRDAELRRIRRVNRSFRLLKIVEASLAVVGTGGAIATWELGHDTLSGSFAGLAVHSALLFGLDHLAEERALVYAGALQDFEPGAPATRGLSIGAVF
jgi:hypothetical protein